MGAADTAAGAGAVQGDAKTMKALEIILLIVLVAFGTGKLRNAGSDLAAAVRGFRSAWRGPRATAARPAAAAPDPRPDAEFPEARARRPRAGA
jgi:sec-independent protein translocase protein TatA